MVGNFGSFGFSNAHLVSGYGVTYGIETETQDQSGKKPSTLIKGGELTTVQLDLTLARAVHTDPEAVIDRLTAILKAAVPYRLVLGGQVVGDTGFLLKTVEVGDATLSRDGKIITCTVSLILEEYVRAGSAAQKTAVVSARTTSTSAPAVVTLPEASPYQVGVQTAATTAQKGAEIVMAHSGAISVVKSALGSIAKYIPLAGKK